MIDCYVVEDEKSALVRIIELIEKHSRLNLVGYSHTAHKAIEEIERLNPRLLFLDMELPDMNGLDILKVLKSNPLIIFSTAYDRYAVDAFNFNAVDFLLKPFSNERFEQAVERVAQQSDTSQNIQLELSQFLNNLKFKAEWLTRIPSRIGSKIFVLNVNDIIYFSSQDKVVLAYIHDDSFIINYTLEELQNRLNPDHFFRIHRSTIVNMDYIQSIEPLLGGTYLMSVKDKKKSKLQVSRSAGRIIRERFNW